MHEDAVSTPGDPEAAGTNAARPATELLPSVVSGSPAAPPALRAIALRKTYPATRRSAERRALDGVDLTVESGEWVALLGPNGSGKSTLVRIVSGADAADSGEAQIYGVSIAGGTGAARRIAAARMGVVFQNPGLDALLSVRENLDAQAALFGATGGEREQRIIRAAEEMGIAERLEDRTSTLSGGFRRRVDLARALMHEPDLLILDEATTGLDHQARSAFLDAIERLRAARSSGAAGVRPLTILMTTHLMDEAERAGRVVMMAAGRVVADGTPPALREACGGRTVRVQIGAGVDAGRIEQVLRSARLEVVKSEGGTVVARAAQDPADMAEAALERTVVSLTRMGLAFEVAPPNLGDAYLALTGTGLEAEAADEPESGRGRRRGPSR